MLHEYLGCCSNLEQKLRISGLTCPKVSPCLLVSSAAETLVLLRINVLWHDDDISGVHLPSLNVIQIRGDRTLFYDCLHIYNQASLELSSS